MVEDFQKTLEAFKKQHPDQLKKNSRNSSFGGWTIRNMTMSNEPAIFSRHPGGASPGIGKTLACRAGTQQYRRDRGCDRGICPRERCTNGIGCPQCRGSNFRGLSRQGCRRLALGHRPYRQRLCLPRPRLAVRTHSRNASRAGPNGQARRHQEKSFKGDGKISCFPAEARPWSGGQRRSTN